MLSSLEIAQAAVMRPIADVAAEAGIEPDELELFGRYKAKVDLSILDRLADAPDAKLINVTAITPTPAGRGQDDDLGLADPGVRQDRPARRCSRCASRRSAPSSASRAARRAAATRRSCRWRTSTSISPATCTRSRRRTTCSRALVDAHRFHRHEPEIATGHVAARDRRHRPVSCGTSSAASAARRTAIPAESGFDITAASEVMAILALATDLADLRRQARRDHGRLHARRRAR